MKSFSNETLNFFFQKVPDLLHFASCRNCMRSANFAAVIHWKRWNNRAFSTGEPCTSELFEEKTQCFIGERFQSVIASERNLVIVGSNPTQVNFLQPLQRILQSCHKVIVVITERAHCFHDCIQLLYCLWIILSTLVSLYQNGKEIKPSYQVLRVSCKSVLQSSACTLRTDAMRTMEQYPFLDWQCKGVLVPRLTKNFTEKHYFECHIELTGISRGRFCLRISQEITVYWCDWVYFPVRPLYIDLCIYHYS